MGLRGRGDPAGVLARGRVAPWPVNACPASNATSSSPRQAGTRQMTSRTHQVGVRCRSLMH
jgi:hypothetical protein